ncbi:MAG: undecaprenyl-diphosphate phosphatase [Candidatus Aenigmatarchaeota archaeon]
MDMIQIILLGTIQGVFEWLPVSSEGIVTLTMTQLFGENTLKSVNIAIWLHLGTMLSAFLYFRKDIKKIALDLPQCCKINTKGNHSCNIFSFILIATLVTSIMGGFLYVFGIEKLANRPKVFTGLMGSALLLTGGLRFYSSETERNIKNTDKKDSLLIGLLQGFSVIPGISRSGSTIFGLFYRKFNGKDAFKLSFLLSIPAVLIANIGMGLLSKLVITPELIVTSLISFIVGYISIGLLLKVADRIEISYLCFIFALIAFSSILI